MTKEPGHNAPELNDLPRESARTILFQFVVFPLGVVLVGVAVFLLFGMLASEEHSIREHVATIRNGSPQRRWQAAYQMSKSIKRGEAENWPDLHLEIETLLREAGDDVMLQRYLTLVLGNLAHPDSVQALVESLRSSDVETVIYGLWSLGEIGSADALPAVLDLCKSDQRDIRKTAIYTLGKIGQIRAIPTLVEALGDSVPDVRWNAALALASFDDDRSLPMLREMLDRRSLDTVDGFREDQKEVAMISAIAPLYRLGSEADREIIRRIASEDPNLTVRSAAKEALVGDS